MMKHRSSLLLVCLCGFTLFPAIGEDGGSKAFLINVGKGQIPNDTGMDDKTVLSIVDSPELGGKALKVPLAAEDSFGVSSSAVSDWKKYARLRFNAFNPDTKTIELELVIVHARSTNYDTRAVQPIKLKPGKNEVTVGIDAMTNVNGSAPDLAKVTKWYIADVSKLGTTFYVGDIWLEGGDTPASLAAGAPAGGAPATGSSGNGPSGSQPLVGYRVKGKVGATEVDLTFTPFLVPTSGNVSGSPTSAAPATSPAVVKVQGDPARLARIRAAKMPSFSKPISFDSPEADAIVSALEVFPPENPWNLDVSDWPLHPNSKNIIASIGANKPLRGNTDMGFVLVPPNQKKIEVKIEGYADESDKGPFPVPDITPIEGWPVDFQRSESKLTLDQVQRNVENVDGDRHAIVLDPVNRKLYEFYQMKKTASGWQAAGEATFDLKSNKLRPDGWTSADAAGLPIFPAVVRYDELKRGMVEHALRVTVVNTRRAYVYPATHFASSKTDENLPRMGERIRLRKDYDVSGHTREVQTILKALQKYGMFVADNGIDWALSLSPDPRIPELHAELRKIQGSDFEVVEAPAGYVPSE